tara:strand:+ start:8617 stop:9111 length:495 start_codon:yes stop_codon:yes gene_type:complete
MDNPLVQPDPGLFFWTIATFLVLLFLLAKFAWKPLLQALESRQEMIKKSLNDAERAKQELEEVQLESNRIVAQARSEAETIIATSRSEGAKLREDLREKAQSEAQSIVSNAEQQIQQERDRALSQIREEAVDVSLSVASKLIQRNLSKEDNEKIIEEALKQVNV